MASTQSGSSAIASLDDYTFDLRHGLRVAARAGLSELENMIMEAGYGWLDGYIESIMESSSRWVLLTNMTRIANLVWTLDDGLVVVAVE